MEPLATGGGAQTMSLGELLAQGGWTMIPIYACSLVGVGVFVHKLLQLRAARLSDWHWFEAVLEQFRRGAWDAAEQAARQTPHPAGRVASAMAVALRERPERVQDEAQRVGSLELQRLESNLGLLSFLAQAAPLLGLLGTVLGMVDLFIGLQSAGGGGVEVAKLSSGIWKALLTTAAGLTVAVPTLAGHSFLASRMDVARLQLSDAIQRVLFVTPASASETETEADHGV